jgi:hypothetical protein
MMLKCFVAPFLITGSELLVVQADLIASRVIGHLQLFVVPSR